MSYDHNSIDKKWQERWDAEQAFRAEDSSKKPKFYTLVEFPFPSGAGLHVGHPRSYTALDVVSRKKRMQGFNVLYPIGWDAFGLPTENYAIKHGRKPQEVTTENINTFRRQLKSLGLSFDWSREVNTSDPSYYKWTQWQFLQFFKAGLAYKAKTEINWCPKDKIGLANEEVVAGKCERCGEEVVKKEKEQWMIAITKYADRLIDDLDTVDYLPKIKKQQIDWIGKSVGAEIDFAIENKDEKITVFTTRPDTLFGVTYVVLAPEHKLVSEIVTNENKSAVDAYVQSVKAKTDIERTSDSKEKTGVFTGAFAIHPLTGEKLPIWVADYVLASYGTGAVMAVPAHDERDNAFAKTFDLPVKQVVTPLIVLTGKNTPKADLPMLPMCRTVDVIIKNENDEYLLQIEDDQVHCVGGGIEEGETPEEAIVREMVEETGYTNFEVTGVVADHVQGQAYRIPKNRNQQCDSKFFEITVRGDERVKSEVEDGKHQQKWVKKEEVRNQLTWDHHTFVWDLYNGKVFTDEGYLVNSETFDGKTSEEARAAIIAELESKNAGRAKTTYRLRDWVFSRQRYWGEPIPLVHCENGCSPETNGWVAIADDQLPLVLPEVEKYEPTDSGESPLAAITDWVNTTCPSCAGAAKRETDTMPNWAGSSWYFLRYIDARNTEAFASKEALKYWTPVDLYNGGMEHTTLHLLYSRFWNKFLFDQGLVPTSEPYAKRHSHGLILAEDGTKMSKSVGNVVNPDEEVKKHGADAFRMYELFIGPFEEPVPWSDAGLTGVRRFLERVARLTDYITTETAESTRRELHKTIAKVTEDIDNMRFNTAVAKMMEWANVAHKEKKVSKSDLKLFLTLLNPFAPHITNEIHEQLGGKELLESLEWPKADTSLLTDNILTIAIQVNGKLRGSIQVAAESTQEQILEQARQEENVARYIEGGVKKEIYVKGKLVNFVV